MNLGLVGMDPRISLFLPCPCFVQTHASVGRNVNSNKPQPRPAASSQAVLASSELQSGVKQPVTRQWGKKWVLAEKWDGCLYAGLVQFKVARKSSSVRILEL